MITPLDPESRPRLRAGCRFSEAPGQDNVLLIPEGLIKLAGPARKILELCDGQRTFAQILSELQCVYPAAPREQMERDTASYLERLRERGAVEY
ncbi:MAG TPA: pyrroloquinoline quinone biosynthesis peptide chaperone PqqD [Solibacterales bacterium]|nr:pyrroloquinoline quinone biosynthesis peptide chaperone PqqD [Bryobacterales bacterium]